MNENYLSVGLDVKVNFVIGEINDDEVHSLNHGYFIISKMILTPDDYKLFRYQEGGTIQVETDHGYRLWCTINHMEVIKDDERVIIIFTLVKAEHTNPYF